MRALLYLLLLAGCTASHEPPPPGPGTPTRPPTPAPVVVDAGPPTPPPIADAGPPPVEEGGCTPGSRRWCNDSVYDGWGAATCRADGDWGPCVEGAFTREGPADRPDTGCACRRPAGYEPACCEDQEDRDGDGQPDCLIPDDHTPPDCTSDGMLCAYCVTHEECGGPDDLCLFARGGDSLCSVDCTDSHCPEGYECGDIRTRSGLAHQCIPVSGTCE